MTKPSLITIVLITLLITAVISWYNYSVYSTIDSVESFYEFKLQMIDEMTVENSSIFFLETSSVLKQKKFKFLNSRQVCSIESAARINPNTNVYVIFVDVVDIASSKFIDGLKQLENVHVVGLNSKSFGDGTPFENFTRNQKLLKSKFPEVHASDFFRLLVLWK